MRPRSSTPSSCNSSFVQKYLCGLHGGQIAIDFIVESVLIARTGGIESPFAVLYVISVTVASLVPRRRVGLLTASLCIILFGLLTNLQLYGLTETWGWLPHTRLSAAETLQAFGVYALSFLVVGFLSGALADQLRTADQSLREKEQGLHRLRAFHENIVNSISSGVFTTDAHGLITSFNPAAEEATGYSSKQVHGRPWREVFNWQPEGLENGGAERVSHNLRFEVQCKRADGNRLILGMTLGPLHEQGETTGLVGVCKDLTQIRDLEEAKDSLRQAIELILEDRKADILRGLPEDAIQDKVLIG